MNALTGFGVIESDKRQGGSPVSKFFRDFSDRYISRIDEYMEAFFRERIQSAEFPFMAEMYEDIREYCLRNGKRIRPLVLLVSYSGYKKKRKNFSEVLKLAAAIEIMHSFLLVQDDIIDKSNLRRGGKSLHILSAEKYSHLTHNPDIGSDVAIVLADVMFSNAVELICSCNIRKKEKDEFLKIFARTYEMTAWGQILDSLHSLPKNIDEKENVALQISTLKTAYYTIYYPMLMGYVLSGGRSSSEMEKIRDFSIPLGMGFQIRDDILGVFGKTDETGKPDDSDILEGKMTLLVQTAIGNLASKKEKKEFISLFTQRKKKKSDIAAIRSGLVESGALESAKGDMVKFMDDALLRLEGLSLDDAGKDILSGLVRLLREGSE